MILFYQDAEVAAEYAPVGYFDKGDWKDQLSLLEEHRESILSRVHEEEKQIDCLDYLVYQIKNRKKQAR
ncbi:MAG: hypothetical protein K2P76_00810 [Lachnospiraceae bacterium]|nr:hypothetical protein [Lachnospiraceae bacterium]MDE6980448.1 hypothetical protein [Lachnospiraceae bacterium]